MTILPPFDAPLLVDPPPAARLTEVLLREPEAPAPPGPAAAPAAAEAAAPAPLLAQAVAGAPMDAAPEALPPAEPAFPTRAELDAILAAVTAPPPPPSAEERAALAGVLGLDPAIAADPLLFDAALAALPEPDAAAVLAEWLSEAGAAAPGPAPEPDWPLG